MKELRDKLTIKEVNKLHSRGRVFIGDENSRIIDGNKYEFIRGMYQRVDESENLY